ncbi:MAG: galactose mutarotase [bacterium]|nr:galactose mutarotase [bacterium]
MTINRTLFGNTEDGQPVYLYTLANNSGMTAKITNYGGIVTALTVPGINGRADDVVLGFDSLEQYTRPPHPYFGTIVGRFCNRIAKAQFTLDQVCCKLAANNGDNHLHGGIKGFDKVVWGAEEFKGEKGVGLRLHYLSKDGEEGYPGNLSVNVTYTLTHTNQLKIDYHAQTDKPTPVNLTHHSYFNLKGAGSGDILDHQLTLYAGQYAPTDEQLIPTGQLVPVNGTPLDFTTSTVIGERIADVKGGYDVSYMVDNWEKTQLGPRQVAEVYEPASGRVMEVFSTEPDIHF